MRWSGRDRGRDEAVLRPSRWPPRPRGATVLRAVATAVLLALAAGIGYARPATGTGCPAPADATRPVTASAADDPRRATNPTDATASTEASAPTEGLPASGGNRGPAAGAGPVDDALPLPSGSVGVPVRLAEPAALAVVRPGSRVDLLAVPALAGVPPTLLATRALVLDVVRPDATDGSAAIYLALAPDQARRTVAMPAGARFAILVRS